GGARDVEGAAGLSHPAVRPGLPFETEISCRSETRQNIRIPTRRVGIAGNRPTLVVRDGWMSDPKRTRTRSPPMPGHHATRVQISPGPTVASWLILAIVLIGQFMVVLDASIVNVALPSIQRDLHFSTSGLQWIVNAYTLTFAGFLLLGGRAADLYGRRKV